MSRKVQWGVALILVAMLGLELGSAAQESQTWDEAVHLSAGVSYWQTGDFRMNPEHPPLLKLWSALPLVLAGVRAPIDDPSWAAVDEWQFGDVFLYENEWSPQQLLLLGRLPVMLLSLLLGAMIFKVSRQWFGTTAGFVSLCLYAFDPSIIAHSRYVTTDLAFALATFFTLLRLLAVLERPTRRNTFLFGLAILLAGLTKFSGAALVASIAGVLIVKKFLTPRSPALEWRNVWRFTVVFIPLAWLTIWMVYAFDMRSPDQDPRIAKLESEREAIVQSTPPAELTGLQRFAVVTLGDTSHGIGAWLDRMKHGTYPTYTFFRGLTAVVSHATGGHGSFLLGEHRDTGWWWYFPFTMLAKTPIPTMVAWIGAIVLAWLAWRLRRRSGQTTWTMLRTLDTRWLVFLGVPLAFMAIAMMGKLNLGWRHVMPIYPPLIVLAGSVVTIAGRAFGWRRWVIPGLIIGNIVFVEAGTYPNQIGYFSPAVGGNHNGPNVLQDSNLDWGQDLPKLQAYVNDQGLVELPFAYYGRARVTDYVPQAIQLPKDNEVMSSGRPRGTVAISVGQLFDPSAGYRWLWPFQPVKRLGSSILVYQLPD